MQATKDLERTLRVKLIYPRYREDNVHFRIGAQRELTRQFTDPQGQAWALMDLLDGSRTLAEVVGEMTTSFPGLTDADVLGGVARFEHDHLLEDAHPSRFDTDPAQSRYVGNVNYFSHFRGADAPRGSLQDELCRSTVTLLGLGGGGSTILQLLCALGVGTVRAVDYDQVETTNLNRQLLFKESDVGKSKTAAAEAMATARNSLQHYEFSDVYLDSVTTISRLIEGSDLVISAVDEPQGIILRMVNKACVAAGIPCVFGASQVSRGRVFSVIPHRSGCIDCMFVHYDEMDPRWAHRFREFGRLGFDAPTLAFAPAIMRLASEMADEATRLLTGYLPPRSVATQLEIDFETGTSDPFLSWGRNAERCPTCGEGDETAFAALVGSPVLTASPTD